MGRLDGKKALITGGTSGIGLETARQFLVEGAEIVVTGRSESGLQAARDALGHDAWVVHSDAGDVLGQKRLAQALRERWDRLDVVFINAGDVTHAPLEQWKEADFDRLMATNLKGPFFLLQALLPMLAKPASVIVCGSASAHIGLPQSSAYAASKAGLLSLARTLSGELAARGIRVNGLSPGPTSTSAFDKLGLAPAARAALFEEIRALVPIGRLGTPQELASAAVYLASDESAYVVGTELRVDGGTTNL